MEKQYNKIILITAPSGSGKTSIVKHLMKEWEMVYEGKYYGTLKSDISRIWKENKVPVLDIDVQGAIHVQQQYPVNTISIFVQAPSVEELKRRLKLRGSETDYSLQARLDKSNYEMTFKDHFKNIIINENFATACEEVEKIVDDFLNN